MITFLFFLSFLSANAVEIVDTGNVMADLTTTTSFEQAFTCSKPVYVYKSACQVSCSDNFCMTSCDPIEGKSSIQAENCSANSVNLYGDQGLEFLVTRADYDGNGKNWVVPFLKSAAQFFNTEPTQIELFMATPAKATFVHDGIKEDMLVLRVDGSVFFQEGASALGLQLYFNPKGKGFDQILQVSSDTDLLYKRKGVFIEDGQ